MKKQVVFDSVEYDNLPMMIIDQIIRCSQEGWGFKFISREDGKELSEDSIRGSLLIPLRKVL